MLSITERDHVRKRDYDRAFDESFRSTDIDDQQVLRSRIEPTCPPVPDSSKGEATSQPGNSQPTGAEPRESACHAGDEYCFGTLDQIAIRFRPDCSVPCSQLTARRLAANGCAYSILQIVFEDGHGDMQSPAGEHVAMLNSETTKRLSKLLSFESLRVEGVVLETSLRSHYGSDGLINAGCVVFVSLNVYGHSSVASMAAAELCRNSLYLQDPEVVEEGVQYDNPLCLKFPEQALATGDIQNRFPAYDTAEVDQPIVPVSHNELGIVTELVTADEITHLAALVDRFASHDYLSQASVDPRIRTSLLAHQKEGLDFLLRRESLHSQDIRSLWEQVNHHDVGPDDDEQSKYQHKITGARSGNAEDIHGGILADDMGLGKSLMMIAVITASTGSALRYAYSLTQPPSRDQAGVIAAKSTLIVVPSVLLIHTWMDEIRTHTTSHALSCYIYHGQKRKSPLTELLSHDVILTTYGTIATEFQRKQGLLFSIQWYRTILDEAHVIRNAATVQWRAVSSISSCIRWCLTGTPIQNSLDDLSSLVSFLRVPTLKEATQFRRHITRLASSSNRFRPSNFHNLRLLLSSICLRRTKAILPFAARAQEHRPAVILSANERRGYKSLGKTFKTAIELAVSGHKSKAAHRTILEALLRLRIYCNNTDYFTDGAGDASTEAEELGSLLQQRDAATCHYCSCDVLSFGNIVGSDCGIVTYCGRAICGDCIEVYVTEIQGLSCCPICHSKHAASADATQPLCSENLSRDQELPSKIQVLCQDIASHRNESKSIVFSFWKKSLDIVERALEKAEIAYLRVDGTIPAHQRKCVLTQFGDAPQGTVLLMTLGTGAVGLNNLCVANRVHILEPQWNPFVESQAIGRVVRLGQTQTVHVVRYIVENTVEEMVHNGQLRKLQLATSGFGSGKSEALKRKSQMLQDLISLV